MARPSIHPILYQAEGGGSASVTQFDSVTELIDASQLGLPVGYYEVPGAWVTHWNGSTFSPTPEQSMDGILTAKGFRRFAELADVENTITFIASQRTWPFAKDYAGLYADVELSSTSTAPSDPLLYLTNNRIVKSYPAKPELQITGDMAVKTYLRFRDRIYGTTLDVVDWSAAGESDPTNFLYRLYVAELHIGYFNETGSSGTNQSVNWWYPRVLHSRENKDSTLEMRRIGGKVYVYLNGLQLVRIANESGGTVNADGSYSVNPTGGGSGVFCNDTVDTTSADIGFLHVLSEATDTPAGYASRMSDWSANELYFLDRNDYAARALDPNIVAVIGPTETGLVDYASDPIAFSTANPACTKLIGDSFWTPASRYENGVSANGSTKTRITGNLTMQCLFTRESTADLYLIEQSASGESEATNYKFRMQVQESSLHYFHEYPLANNVSVSWSTPPLFLQEPREYRIVRENDGANQKLRAYMRLFAETEWTQLTVSAVSPGTGAGTTEATVPAQGGGDATTFRVNDNGNAYVKQVLIYNAALDP